MAQTAGLIFTNDSGAGGGTSQYVIDTLPDYTFYPNNNTGFSSTVSNNPLNNSYANTDLPQYGAKYLPIKDLVLLSDRSKWINGKDTYQVIFQENFPQVQAYAFGNIQLNYTAGQGSVLIKTIGDGISINGVIRQVAFVLQPNSAATATAQVVVDGSNEATTIDFSSYTTSSLVPPVTNVFSAYLHNTTMESYNIHDIRLTANQSGILNIAGIVVYFQSPNNLIDQFPGTSYVNKVKVATAAGVSLSIPSFGSSLGGNFLIYKTALAGYTMSALSATTIASTASGSSGTNLLSMAVGTGASLLAGYGMILTAGASTYVGSITSISTDTLTMGNTLGFGTSTTGSIYTAWKGGVSLPINASLMTLAYSIDFSRMNPSSGFSQTIFDPKGNYALWGNNVGFTILDGNQCAVFLGASGFMQVDGYYSAAEIETLGNGVFAATLSVNGFASWSQSAGQTGVVKKTVFTDAGPGWNSFNIGCGASMTAGISITPGMGIQRINLYQRSRDISVSYGFLSDFDICQTYTNRDSINASLMALGGIKRVYADQIYFKNTWLRGQTWSVPGGVYYQGASTNGSLSFQYYGTNFGVCATFYVGGTLSLDGVGVGLTANVMQSVATLGFHTVSYTGGTAIISAIDYLNPAYGKSKIDANISAGISTPVALIPPTIQIFTGGTGTYTCPTVKRPIYIRVVMAGGGGGGSGSSGGGGTGGTGGNTIFGTSLLICSGGVGGAPQVVGGVGGTAFIGAGLVGVGLVGGSGEAGNPGSTNPGGNGGTNPLGGAGGGAQNSVNAINAPANCGGGGGGGGSNGTGSGAGGGAGAYIETFLIPSGSYFYQVGAGGFGSTLGGQFGGNGGNGSITIYEHYQ